MFSPNRYFSTFISGFDQVIDHELRKIFPDIKIIQLLDGLVIYQTKAASYRIKQIRFINNSFFLIHQINVERENKPQTIIKQLLKEFDFETLTKIVTKGNKSFRFVISQANQFVSINKLLLSKLETRVQQFARLSVNRTNPDIEFWIFIRRENLALFGMRIAQHQVYEKTFHPGELRPQFAHLLCLLSERNKTDIVLDPFCGYGSIVLERAKYFPYLKIYAGDYDSKLIQNLKLHSSQYKNFQLYQLDTLNLKKFFENSINKIITDPPWGIYQKIPHLANFYSQMLNEFSRVLNPQGLAIILTGAKHEFESALKNWEQFKLLNQYHILVSGKKASVYKLRKQS